MELLVFICTIDIDPNAKPVHFRPYLVPHIHLKTFKKVIGHLVRIGVLAPQQKVNGLCPHSLLLKRMAEYIDQQLTSTEQSHSTQTQVISVADNHGHFVQAFWI
jgi:hypothetical protein